MICPVCKHEDIRDAFIEIKLSNQISLSGSQFTGSGYGHRIFEYLQLFGCPNCNSVQFVEC